MEDYKIRFINEYKELKDRYEKLKKFNTKIEASIRTEFEKNKVDMPKHDCPSDLLREQQSVMGQYLHILELRAEIEHIDFEAPLTEKELTQKQRLVEKYN